MTSKFKSLGAQSGFVLALFTLCIMERKDPNAMNLDMKRRLLSLSVATAMLVSVAQPVVYAAEQPADPAATGESQPVETPVPESTAAPEEEPASEEEAAPEEPAAPVETETPAAEEEAPAVTPLAVYEDAVNTGTWTGNEFGTVAVEDGWLHIKSTSGDNHSEQFYVTNDEISFNQAEGYVEFTLKPNGAGAKTRFGVYLRSNGAKDGFFLGYDAGGWFWQMYDNGTDGAWYQGTRIPAPNAGDEVKVRIDYTETEATVTINGQDAFGGPVDLSAVPSSRGGSLAFKGGTYNNAEFTDVFVKDIHFEGQQEVASYTVSGSVTADGKAAAGATVEIDGKTAVTGEDGTFTISDLMDGTYTATVTMEGYGSQSQQVTVAGGNVEGLKFALASAPTETIFSDEMTVTLYKDFPAVKQYDMKGGELDGKTFYGSASALDTIQINGNDIELSAEDVELTLEDSKATYVLHVKDDTGVDASIKVVLSVEGNVLSMEIPEVVYNQENGKQDHPVQTIYFPNHSLVSVRSSQDSATFAASEMSDNTRKTGDTFKNVDENLANGRNDYMYAFVSADGMSATMESNSEHDGSVVANTVYGGSTNTRIWATASDVGSDKVMSLGSALFYWNRALESKDESDPTGETTKTYVTEPTENPLVKVIITGDENKNGTVDWQDGAIAFREISHELLRSEEVPEAVGMRVCMNFSGQAPNPFMQTLDNVKRVYLNTDGLGQAVLLKGYANEGHDSGHPDYADIGQRLGGAEDMNKLMIEGAKLGATFGIHVNASEMYTEAKAFDELLVRRNSSGGLRYGWNWLDQGIGIDSLFDLVSGRREARFDALEELVGQNLGWVYVDVWGNMTSTLEDSWATRRLTDEITSNGWRMTTEWGAGNEYDSTFQHWATDLTYGGYTSKGYNSSIARFIRNHQKDSWVGDYTSYGGNANAPLLGGYDMKDFEGWQGRSNYDDYINNLFTNNISTKFFQHFLVTKWVNGEAIENPYGSTWVPEKEITLEDETYGKVVVTRTDAENYSEDVMSDYRDRTVTLNGKVILKGHVSRSDNNQKGDETYLIPWYWSATGEDLPEDEQKLYHWNTQGGTTEWELPNGWENLENVVVYTLSDQGKSNETVVPVVDGKVTLTAEAEVPYVVYKGEQGQLDIGGWQGNHLYDTGFNTYSLEASKWTVNAGNPKIDNTVTTNPMMILAGGDSVSQTITDLVPGQAYALYIGVDNRSEANARMSITSVNGSVLASNYTGLSFANNYVSSDPHSNNIPTEKGAGSHFQNMYVFFVADAETATLTLSRDAGEGLTYFDNMRCVENEGDPYTYDENGDVVLYTQDFENVVQGMYPFVVGPVEGVTDNRSHLSELHAPYTQSGWDVKKGDDVLDGNWSLKSNGLVQRNSVLYQTIPQNFRFEPGCTYKVSFDYQIGSDGTYAVVVGNEGSYDASKAIPLSYKADENGEFITQTFEMTITGEANGQTWFGLYSTNKAPNKQGTSGAAATFGDYSNLMIDNVRIERVDDTETITKDQLNELIDSVKDYTFETAGCTADEWQDFETALAAAKAVAAADDASDSEIKSAYLTLKSAKTAVDTSAGLPADDDRADLDRTQMTAEVGNPELGEDGDNLLDNDPNTIYHTNWSGASGKPIATAEDFWIEVTLNEPQTVNGLRYLPRNSGSNGKMTAGTIEVQVEGNEEWIPVTAKGGEGNAFTFSTSGWSKANFEPVENVVKVRLVATSTIGDQPNKFFSTSEIRLTTLFSEEAPAMDTTALETAINMAKTLNKDRYTADSWKAVEEALANAEKVLADETATAEQIAAAARTLNAAIDALVMPVDKAQVEELLAMYNSMAEEDFIGGWAAVKAAAAKLQAVLDGENATQTEANAAIKEFLVAVKDLQPTEAKRVKDAIASAEEVLNNVSSAAFTEESWKAAQDALKAAKDLVAAGEVTAEQADKAIADLQNAVKALTPSDSKVALDSVIETAQGMNSEEYTTSSWKAVEEALANALAVQGDTAATTEDYTNAVAAMTDAMGGLVKRGDTAALAKFVEQAKALKEENYTPDSWKPFAEKLAAAEDLLANSADASQADVDAAYAFLLQAQTELVRAADKSELNAAVAEANKLNKDDYTSDSWNAVAKAKEAAAAVAADANATQAEVDAARDALLKAIRELVKVSQPNPDPSNPSDGSSSSGSTLPATGDNFAALAVAGLLAVSAGAAAVLNKKRKMDK